MDDNDHNQQDSRGRMPDVQPTISIVVPSYSEEGNVIRLYQEVIGAMKPVQMTWELIYVDDGSADHTWAKITELHERDPNVKGLRLSRNFGHQYALLAGLQHALGAAVVTMDADLQHPPAVLPRLIEAWEGGHKVVHTVRVDNQAVSKFKKVTSWGFYKAFAALSGVKLSEGMADFRLLDRQVVQDLLRFRENGLFLRGLVHWVGYPSTTVEYLCQQRYAGRTKYNLRKMLRFAWYGVTSFSLIPLRLTIGIGFITSVVAFGIIIYAFWVKLFTDQAVQGWTTTVSVIAFLFGVLFILLGILGEYIGRILEEVQARPRFIIREHAGFVGREAHTEGSEPDVSVRRFPSV